MSPPDSTPDSASNGKKAWEAYEVSGDAASALEFLMHGSSSGSTDNPTESYNRSLLEAMCRKGVKGSRKQDNKQSKRPLTQKPRSIQAILDSIEDAEENLLAFYESNTASKIPSRKRRRDEWTITYNRGLLLLAQGKPRTSMALVWKKLGPVVVAAAALQASEGKSNERSAANNASNNQIFVTKELRPVACRMALLLLESILNISMGSPIGIAPVWDLTEEISAIEGDDEDCSEVNDGSSSSDANTSIMDLETLLKWLQETIEQVGADRSNDDKVNAQLKFSLSLYTARMDFLQREKSNCGKLEEAQIRSARKELKHAMEIFQHKLKPNSATAEESASLNSSSTNEPNHLPGNSTVGSATGTNNSGNYHHGSDLGMSSVLKRQNQATLNLKANTEQLKGNMKKSLILCGEAQAAVTDSVVTGGGGDSNASGNESSNNEKTAYDATHYNNLAIVYESHGKPHLAVHAWSKALRCVTASAVEADGTVRLDTTSKILYNASIGSLKTGNYRAAYECMGTCLQHSAIWSARARCWLRLGEACIGMWSRQNEKYRDSNGIGGRLGFSPLYVRGEAKGINFHSNGLELKEIGELAPVLASPRDLEQVQTNPLPRGKASFETALSLFEAEDDSLEKDQLAYISAQLSLSYIALECREFRDALKYADAVLKNNIPEGLDAARRALFERQMATASMYASEAACVLGDAPASMHYLVKDGKKDAFDRLASELGGVTIETAASHAGTEGKTRLAKAQAMVRCSASAASAQMGNDTAAKQLAMSAQAMFREGSYATKALVYCMLRQGNHGAALTLLRSAR